MQVTLTSSGDLYTVTGWHKHKKEGKRWVRAIEYQGAQGQRYSREEADFRARFTWDGDLDAFLGHTRQVERLQGLIRIAGQGVTPDAATLAERLLALGVSLPPEQEEPATEEEHP